MYSPLQHVRMQYKPKLPDILKEIAKLQVAAQPKSSVKADPRVISSLPHLHNDSFLAFIPGTSRHHDAKRVGVVFSGGQAAGGHNVITGLFDALKKLHPQSQLFGFLNGPKGIIENESIEITEGLLIPYRNQGGFDLIGSGRTKIETPEQFQAAEKAVRSLNLDGLVIIGGDDSNTNAALLADYFIAQGCSTRVIGVPKTIDGDLKSDFVEVSFGFDTACKTYSEIIGNILRDCLSAKKSYYFIKLMGRSASHVALECALQTHPNMAFVGEEVAEKQKTLMQLTTEIADMICVRAAQGKDFGVILIPEGIIEFIPEFKKLISELNKLLAADKSPSLEESSVVELLSPASAACYKAIPKDIQKQLLIDRDSHGNVQVSKIETERLFIDMVRAELKKRKQIGTYTGSFSAQPLFCGYEGRSCLPSNFDAQYCYALGCTAALLIDANVTGYICTVQGLSQTVSKWQIGGCSLVSMMGFELRQGKEKPIIRRALVNLQGAPFKLFQKERAKWQSDDDYRYPGPIQFFGPEEFTDATTMTLQLESAQRSLP